MNENRRKLLITSLKGSLGLAAFSLVAPMLSGCKKKTSEDSPVAAKEVELNTCPGAVNDQEKAIRTSLKYVDNAPSDSQTCDNCKLYTLPQNGSPCGGCKVVPGPIHPKGYCAAWLHRMS